MTVKITFGDSENEEFKLEDEALPKAIALHEYYVGQFRSITIGDREATSVVRERLRADESFWELSAQILEIVDNAQDWISAIIRVEAKRAFRQYAGRMEEIRLERLARQAAEKLAEQEEMSGLSNFGMF